MARDVAPSGVSGVMTVGPSNRAFGGREPRSFEAPAGPLRTMTHALRTQRAARSTVSAGYCQK
jgi:hypothetical protein